MKAKRILAGQVALVTGGGRGIGKAVALALSARGVKILVTGRGERALGETVGEVVHGGGTARHLAGDVRDPAHLARAVDRAVTELGSLDIVVASAGVPPGPAGETALDGDLDRARATIETHLLGAVCTFHAALARMNDGGRLVAIGGEAGDPVHDASKAGVAGLVRALAVPLASRGITANVVVPRSSDDDDAVAEMVVFLAGAGGSAVTGQTLRVETRNVSR